MSKLNDTLKSSDFVKPASLVGQVVTVVDFTPTEYEYGGRMNKSATIQAVTADGEEIKLSGTGTMCDNLQALKASPDFDFPLDLRIVAFRTQFGNTGYGFNDPDEE